jgi:hypothetical protein
MIGFIPAKHPVIRPLKRLAKALVPCAVVFIFLAGCSGSNYNQLYNPTPAITAVFPSSITAGSGAFTLSVTGTGFVANSLVYWNNTQLTTSFNSENLQLSSSVPASDVASPGVAQVIVVTPTPGGGMSNAAVVNINPVSNPQPTIASLSPSSTGLGALPPNGVLVVNGTNFIQGSLAAFNGVSRTPAFVSATQLRVPMTAADVSANSTISVTVSNPAPGGGVSNAASFVVGTGSAIRQKAGAITVGAQFPQLISMNALGGAANGKSGAAAISADGRFVAFYSTATNLVASGASGNIFVRDTCLSVPGCIPQTIAVDLAEGGTAPNAKAHAAVAISGDGRFVAFVSSATNLLSSSGAAPTAVSQVYVRDLCVGASAPAGCAPHTEVVSVGAEGAAMAGSSDSPSISSDGRYVAFASSSNLGGASAIFVRDTCAGSTAATSCVSRTYSVPLSVSGAPAGQVTDPVVSGDGRYVAFVASDPAAPQNSRILLADMCFGSEAPANCKISVATASVGADASDLAGVNGAPSVSDEGRFIVFESQIPGDTPKVYLRDTCLGASAGSACVPSTSLLQENALAPSISSTGRYVSYISNSGPTSTTSAASASSLFIHDTCFGAIAACTPQEYAVTGAGVVSNAPPFTANAAAPAVMSSDASFVVFSSSAPTAGLPLSGQGDVLLSITPF